MHGPYGLYNYMAHTKRSVYDQRAAFQNHFCAALCIPVPVSWMNEPNQKPYSQVVSKRIYDFYDQTEEFLLAMQSILEDIMANNQGIGIFSKEWSE